MTVTYFSPWSSKLALLFSCFTACATSTPTPKEVVTEDSFPEEKVDVTGNWSRWQTTPEIREKALEHLASVPTLKLGREATAEEIALVDIDVMPDGTGLPDGEGTVSRGKSLYNIQCIQCHGPDGRGAENEALAGRNPKAGFPFSESTNHILTVGNYWPYATTLYDYIYRAMPQAAPGTLPPNDVYSLVAFILYLNEIVAEDMVLNSKNLPLLEMPAQDRFVYDDRKGGFEIR